MTDAARPLFILSFRQRDELAGIAARAGWRVAAARRDEGLARRIVASGASVVVIDARGAVAEGLDAARAVGDAVAAAGRALLVLVSRGDGGAIGAFFEVGATHFLASPMREVEFVEALRFADRHAQRVSGGWVAEAASVEPLGWRYDAARRSLQLSPGLARVLHLPASAGRRRALRALDRETRAALRAALRRLAGDGSTAFAHDLPGLGRVVEHLQRDAVTRRVHALVEPLGEAPDASAALRDVFPRRTRSVAALARDLPGAIERDEIDILFQPQVDIATGAIIGVEALARWQHPRLGEVGAEALLAAADRGGRAPVLSAYLQRRALEDAARWPSALAALRVAVNVAATDVAEAGFVDRLLDRIDISRLPRERVTIEVTESELIENLSTAAASLASLRQAGCRIAIDDFGTGYSSLAYLAALPIDYLKLDKALTRGIGSVDRDRIVVRGVIAMARSLGVRVIAEGVETEAQRALLAVEGCDLYQGYLCAPPVTGAALADLVAGPAGR